MRKLAIVSLTAAALLGFAAVIWAGPLSELAGKDIWFILSDKADKPTGFIHEMHSTATFEGKSAVKSYRLTWDKATGKSIEQEYVRESNNPLLSLTVKVNGAVVTTAKAVKDGWEFQNAGQTKLLKKTDIDFFSYDDQGIFESVKPGEPSDKLLKIWDVVNFKKVENRYRNDGMKEITQDGKKIEAIEMRIYQGTTLSRAYLAKATLIPFSWKEEGSDLHGKRASKEDVSKAFPGVVK
jgi:hypothetical protein